MSQLFAYVNDDTLQAAADGTAVGLQATTRGELRVVDFFTHMALQGRCYQIKAGTIATGVAMDSVVTDAAAEGSVDALSGTTIIPVDFSLSANSIATATTVKARIKAVGVVSSAGTAFVPLPLLQGGTAATSTARVANNGGVTVTAELATTTRALFHWDSLDTQTPTTDTNSAAMPSASVAAAAWRPRLPYVGKGAACVYVQLAATTAFPLYFFTLDYIEIPSINL